MDIKNIDKLEDLKGHEWECRGLQLKLDGFDIRNETLQLHSKNFLSEIGDIIGRFEFIVSKYNLEQLEFYGLKVVLNEKPKLTRKERNLLECHRDIYIARDCGGKINIYSKEPQESILSNVWFSTATQLQISNELFKFIVWESGKAWSKSELMELEVVD